jgi:cytochrome P450
LPFGGGVRRCVGAAFAQFEAKIVLDELTRALERRPAGRLGRWIGGRGVVLVPPRRGAVVATRRRPTATLTDGARSERGAGCRG